MGKVKGQSSEGANNARRGGTIESALPTTPFPPDSFSFTVACFVDWENLRKTIFESASKKFSPLINYNHPPNLFKFFRSFLLPNERFYRIFIYLSAPIPNIEWNGKSYDLTDREAYKKAKAFIERMSRQDLIAIRKGKLKVLSLQERPDGSPKLTLVQKQVDMLMGLDVAHVAYRRLADRILMFSYDTDVVPALKTARINGLQVIVAECPDIRTLDHDLKTHADFIRSVPFEKIFPCTPTES